MCSYARQPEDQKRDEDPSQFKPLPPPSRLEALLITNQINNHCQQINQFAGQGFSKLYMVAGLHQGEEGLSKI
jgi:hypothetical protein